MGQKVHPRIVRLRITEPYRSLWYANKKNFAKYLLADLDAREYLMKLLKAASVSDVIIERPTENARITIKTARPGIVIGRKGEDVEKPPHHDPQPSLKKATISLTLTCPL